MPLKEKARPNMVPRRSNHIRQQWIKTLIIFLIAILFSCGLIPQKRMFKYFQLERLPVIEKIVYADKKGLNNLIIEMKAQHGNINILCIPFTPQEYEEYLLLISKAGQAVVPHETIELEISGRQLKATKKNINENRCFIHCDDYYKGIALFLSYFGDCNISTGLRPILASMKYHFSKETADIARRDFLDVMNSIEKFSIPVYDKASGVQQEYSFIGFTKRITYRAEIEPYSVQILNFYQQFFAAHSWKPHNIGKVGDWFQNRLFYTWIDGTGEIVARLLILAETSTSKDVKLAQQTVIIDLMPYMVMQWGEGGKN